MADGFRGFLARWMGGAGASYPAAGTGALLIAGVDRSGWIKKDTGRFRRAFNQRSTFNCQVEDLGRGYVPQSGSELIVFNGPTRLFAGYITSSKARRHPSSAVFNNIQFDVEATDYNIIADNRRVYYPGFIGVVTIGPGYAGDLVRAIAAIAFTGESISLSGVEQGPFIASPLTFFYETAAEALNKISAVSGFRWRIDEYKVLQFSDFQATPAPFSITDTSQNWRNLTVTRDLRNYRNVEHVRTETSLLGSATETFTGDGTTGDFFIGIDPVSGNPVRFMANPPVVTLDYGYGPMVLSIGRLGFDIDPSAFDAVYDVGGVGLHFATLFGHTIPPAASTLVITYDYLLGNVATASDAALIAQMQAISGGSGIWEGMNEQRNISSGATLLSIGEGDLDLYGLIPTTTDYETDEQGLEPGQVQPVNLPYLGVAGSYLVESIDTQWLKVAGSHLFRHQVTVTDVGPLTHELYRAEKLAEVARIGVPRASAVLTDIAGPGGGGFTLIGRSSPGTSGNYMVSSTINDPLDGSNGPFTIAFWAKVSNLGQTNKIVLQVADVGGAFQWRIDFGRIASSFSFHTKNGIFAPLVNLDTGILMSDVDTWHHICYRKAGAGSSAWDFFVDGLRTSINSAINFTIPGNLTHTWMFDDRNDQNFFGGYFDGSLGEIAIWTEALTNGEVTALAAGAAADTLHSSGLFSYWKIVGDSPELNDGSSGVSLTINGTLPFPG